MCRRLAASFHSSAPTGDFSSARGWAESWRRASDAKRGLPLGKPLCLIQHPITLYKPYHWLQLTYQRIPVPLNARAPAALEPLCLYLDLGQHLGRWGDQLGGEK
jgi:hypothetical protein